MRISKTRLKQFIAEQVSKSSGDTSVTPLDKWKYILWAITQTTKDIPKTIKWLDLDVTDCPPEFDQIVNADLSAEVMDYLKTLQLLKLKKEKLKGFFIKLDETSSL